MTITNKPKAKKSTLVESQSTLLIKSNDKHSKVLSKDEIKFNQLVSKIEYLEKKLISTEQLLNIKLDYYVKYIIPIDNKINEYNLEFIKSLNDCRLQKSSFTKGERAKIKDILMENLYSYISLKGKNNIDDFTKNLYKELHGVSIDFHAEESFEQSKKDLEDEFARNGFDINLDDLKSDMTQEEIFNKFNEMRESFHEKFSNQNKKARPKSKKQLEKEKKEKEIEEVKNRSIGTIYKQLAKILHPDLELDEDLKIEKQEYMKQLNVAYKNKDIHTLLKLEMLWINKVENSKGNLTEDMLKIYIEVLKEQVKQLENNEQEILFHPRYQVLHNVVNFSTQIKLVKMDDIKKKYELELIQLEKSIANLKSTKFVTEVKKIIKSREEEDFYSNLFDIFSKY